MTAAIGGVFIVFVKTRAGNNTFAVNCNKKTTEIQYNILAYSMYLNIILKTKKQKTLTTAFLIATMYGHMYTYRVFK